VKLCPTCQQIKPKSEFGKNKAKADGLQNQCNPCRKSYNATYYQKTKEVQNPKRYLRHNEWRQEVRQRLRDYLLDHPCVDCGEADIIVLQFDHQYDKVANLSVMIGSGFSWQRILDEIKKCQVVCANCHMRRTAKAQNWFRASTP
jgi:hypothetical protein